MIDGIRLEGDKVIRTKAPYRRPDLLNKEVPYRLVKGYKVVSLCGKNHLVHRLVWEFNNGQIPGGLTIDHINGDRLDNNLSNLRLATVSQNNHNQGKRKSDGLPKGIYLLKGKYYLATVMANKVKHSHLFKSLEEATCWLTKKREELHGSFCNHG